MPQEQRNAVFIPAIRDAGMDCQQVESAAPVDAGFNLPAWRATCQGGGDYLITIAPDGTARIQSVSRAPGGSGSGANGTAPAENRQD